MTDWQPIETAPWPEVVQLGSEPFLASDDVGPVKECYAHHNGWIYSADKKLAGSRHSYGQQGDWKPTVWMPLPEPPKSKE